MVQQQKPYAYSFVNKYFRSKDDDGEFIKVTEAEPSGELFCIIVGTSTVFWTNTVHIDDYYDVVVPEEIMSVVHDNTPHHIF